MPSSATRHPAATGAPALAEPRLAEVPQWTEREVLGHEKELLGFYVTGHPLGEVAQELARFTDVTAGTAEGREDREVRAGGLLVSLRETRTRRSASAKRSRVTCRSRRL